MVIVLHLVWHLHTRARVVNSHHLFVFLLWWCSCVLWPDYLTILPSLICLRSTSRPYCPAACAALTTICMSHITDARHVTDVQMPTDHVSWLVALLPLGKINQVWNTTQCIGYIIGAPYVLRPPFVHAEKQELSAFRNYSRGEPSLRLYIKNLSKQATEEVRATTSCQCDRRMYRYGA